MHEILHLIGLCPDSFAHPDLLDIDFKSKRLLGNFPQAYSHLALINTAIKFNLKHNE